MTIHGIDFSPLMFKKAGKLNKGFIEKQRVDLRLGDFSRTENYSYRYNHIFCVNVIYFWDQPIIAFLKIHRLLEEDGHLYIYMASVEKLVAMKKVETIFNMHSIDYVIETLTKAGFSDVVTIYENGYYITAKK